VLAQSTTLISFAGMAELADALDSGNDTLVNGYLDLVAPSSETSLRVKIKGQNVIARATSSLFALTYYFICGYGGTGRRARFRV